MTPLARATSEYQQWLEARRALMHTPDVDPNLIHEVSWIVVDKRKAMEEVWRQHHAK